jgi:6-phosphogluconolactonase
LVNLHSLRITAAATVFAAAASGAEYLVYAGAGTGGGSRGIYGYRFDTHAAKLKPLGLVATISNPTYLVEHPDHRFLYAVSEDAAGAVSAFLIDPKNGRLSLVNKVPSHGAGPCHLALDRGGRWLAVANCSGGGGVAVLPLRKDGGLGEAPAPVEHHGVSRTECVLFSPDNRFLLVADSGLNRIYVYGFDPEKGTLTPAATPFIAAPAGAGVRRLVFHPNGRIMYAGNQTQPGVTAYRYDPATGNFAELETVATVPPSPDATGACEVAVNAAGTMVYASSRGSDSLALLVVDPVRFTLSILEATPLVGGAPRYFALDPTGAYLLVANRDSAGIGLYTVHPHTGQLRPVGRPAHIDRPASVVFVPAM